MIATLRMTFIFAFCCLIGIAALEASTRRSDHSPFIHHDLRLTLDPATHGVEMEDTVTIPGALLKDKKGFTFSLSKDLSIKETTFVGMAWSIKDEEINGMKVRTFSCTPPPPGWQEKVQITVKAKGTIYHPLQKRGREYSRSFKETAGIISPEGVYLSDESYAWPTFDLGLVTFDVTATLPAGWRAVSEGRRLSLKEMEQRTVSLWQSLDPMDGITVVAGKWHEYNREDGKVMIYAFLREDDPALAEKYMEATETYLDFYSGLIGPYPYGKFALVENFWETGYGMPSFTLLGPTVIRLPFILHSSYPHEILHNWWGNGVFVDYSKGNWCEGLTAYMADHLLKEVRGKGETYRRDTLMAYTDFAARHHDFPLTQFHERHSAATQAVGYGKALMLFHMLRRELGDETFIKTVRTFYREYRGKSATFFDLMDTFASVGQVNLDDFEKEWLEGVGAPEIILTKADVKEEGGQGRQWRLHLEVEQVQEGSPFSFTLPVGIALKGDKGVVSMLERLPMNTRSASWDRIYDKQVLSVHLDPAFDLFRILGRDEVPATLSRTLGAQETLILVPGGNDALAQGYAAVAEGWKSEDPKSVSVVTVEKSTHLMKKKAVWIFGRSNVTAAPLYTELSSLGVTVGDDSVTIKGKTYSLADNAFVFTVPHPDNPSLTCTLLFAADPAILPLLARKVVHYGKYSYLVFKGKSVTNVAKGEWPAIPSKLVDFFTSPPVEAALPPGSPIAVPGSPYDKKAMIKTLSFLASDDLLGRGLGSEGLEQAARRIEKTFQEAGLKPLPSGSYRERMHLTFKDGPKVVDTANIIGILPGSDPNLKDEAVVVGAHYDHLGLGWPDVHAGDKGKIHNGADDNASGVTLLLSLGKIMVKSPPPRTLLFIAFTGEEEGRLGSRYFLSHPINGLPKRIVSMVNLDTVGRLDQRPLYVLGAQNAQEWPFIVRGAGMVTGLKVEVTHEPLDSSDQVSFIEKGIPAIQLFSGPTLDYHRPTDDVEKIDFDGMVKIALFTREILDYLVSKEAHLTPAGAKGEPTPSHTVKGERKVTLGIMPDFGFSGKGVRVARVVPGSPAEAAGLEKDEVITKMDDTPITSLKAMANFLRTCRVGQRVKVLLKRGEKIRSVVVTLKVR